MPRRRATADLHWNFSSNGLVENRKRLPFENGLYLELTTKIANPWEQGLFHSGASLEFILAPKTRRGQSIFMLDNSWAASKTGPASGLSRGSLCVLLLRRRWPCHRSRFAKGMMITPVTPAASHGFLCASRSKTCRRRVYPW